MKLKFIELKDYTHIDEERVEEEFHEEPLYIAVKVIYSQGSEVLAVAPHSYVIADTDRKRYIQRETLGEVIADGKQFMLSLAIIDAIVSLDMRKGISVLVDTGIPEKLFYKDIVFNSIDEMVETLAKIANPVRECKCFKKNEEIPEFLLLTPRRLLVAGKLFDDNARAWLCEDGTSAVKVRKRCFALS